MEVRDEGGHLPRFYAIGDKQIGKNLWVPLENLMDDLVLTPRLAEIPRALLDIALENFCLGLRLTTWTSDGAFACVAPGSSLRYRDRSIARNSSLNLEKRTAKAAAETTALLRDAQLASVAKQAAAELAAKKKVADKLRETAATTAANKAKQHAANVVAKEAANVAAKEAEKKAKAKVVEATTAMPKPTPATRSAAAALDNHYNIIPNIKASASSAPPTKSKPNTEASASSASSPKTTKPAAKANAKPAPPP
ncbi:hypothetical protein T492DRAFT_862310 [Pavlovales sp. CCMP2436]|nr:hypothetical protein T492DRAFT_862310 [Pavlovales sp. CCMP2436]